MKKGEIAEAQALYVTILKAFPNNKKAQQGLTALDGGQLSPAEQGPPQAVIDQLMSLYRQGQLELVVDQAQDLTVQFPKAIALWNILGASAAQLGKLDQAVKAFEEIIFLNPNQASSYYNLGNALKDQGKVEEAIEAYNKALVIKPDYEAALNNVVIALKTQGESGEKRLKKALETYNEAQTLKTENANSYFSRALDLQVKGKLDEAIDAYKKALAIKPDYAEAYSNMGVALQEQGKLEEAIEAYNRALAIKPDYAEAYFNMGNPLKDQGKLEEAIAAYNKALAIKPDYAEAYSNMGNALKDQGKLEEAIAAYNKALAIKPDYAEAYSNMGNALQEQGKLEEAIEAYNKALAIKPDYAEAYSNMGNALKKQGMLEDAIEAYNKALALKPDQANATENRLNLLIQLQGTALTRNEKLKQIIEDKQTDITWRPKSHIFHAISSFLSADENQAHRHIYNFKTCNSKLLDDLSPKDQVFCSAYSNYLSALLQKPLGEASGLGNSNLVYHIGESHCLSYAHRNIKINGATSRIAPMITFGAKAFHFSKATDSAFKAITKANLDSIPKGSQVFVSFGEIDCRPDEGFISAATKLDQSVEDIIANTVTGYLQWFAQHNKAWNHNMHFLNVPAPEYDQTFDAKVNGDVANIVALFNHKIKEQIAQYNFNMIDVFGFTLGKNGFSNSHFHIDARHLGAKAIPEIEHQLNS
jgi:tetratricopeptide (TPR) repeat protein